MLKLCSSFQIKIVLFVIIRYTTLVNADNADLEIPVGNPLLFFRPHGRR